LAAHARASSSLSPGHLSLASSGVPGFLVLSCLILLPFMRPYLLNTQRREAARVWRLQCGGICPSRELSLRYPLRRALARFHWSAALGIFSDVGFAFRNSRVREVLRRTLRGAPLDHLAHLRHLPLPHIWLPSGDLKSASGPSYSYRGMLRELLAMGQFIESHMLSLACSAFPPCLQGQQLNIAISRNCIRQ